MNLSKAFSSLKTTLYHKYGENPGTMLVHTGTAGWILSCAAQMLAIVTNDKIDNKQKAFLLPQEFGDGMINILSFYILTASVKNLASTMVKNGKIANKAIKNYLEKNGLKDKIGKFDFNIKDTNNFAQIKDEFTSFKNGTDIVASTLGSVLSCNIVTPVLRNEYAAKRQQQINDYRQKHPFGKVNSAQMYNRPTMGKYLNDLRVM